MRRADTHLSTEALAAYVDGELAAGPSARAQEHVETCGECRLAVAIQRQTKVSLGGASVGKVPSELMARLSAIPFVADVDVVGPPNAALSLSGNGTFQFSVAAPARRTDDSGDSDSRDTGPPRRFGESRPFGGRHRTVALSAAVLAFGVGMAVGPSVFAVGSDTASPTPTEPLTVTTVGWR